MDTGKQRLARGLPKNRRRTEVAVSCSGSHDAVGGTITHQIELRSNAGAAGTRIQYVSARCAARAPHGLIRRRYALPTVAPSLTERSQGGLPDVDLCPDVAPDIDDRFDCCDLLQRSVIHDGPYKASAMIEDQA